MKYLLCIFLTSFCLHTINAQIDKGIFKPYQSGFYETSLLKSLGKEVSKAMLARKSFKSDFNGIKIPSDTNLYKRTKYLPAVSQGMTGTCWCFATTSFMESEILRITGKGVKLSEMYTVYWEYVDRAQNFVQTRGKTYFNEGSEASSIPIVWKKYGIVPLEVFSGKLPGQAYHNHQEMVSEMSSYLDSIKTNNIWNEEKAISDIKNILKKYMGEPPAKFNWQGKEYSPTTFLTDVVMLNLNDYYNFMSTLSATFMEKSELIEDDNWRHYDDYYNLNCNDFSTTLVDALKKEYSVCICGDVSEPGIDSFNEGAYIPTFDIPQEYINDDARQLRLTNGSTTDDHCMHVVGWYFDGKYYWFLFKDSGAGGFDGPNKGYRFIREDFVKLKMMNLMMHKNAAPILNKIIK